MNAVTREVRLNQPPDAALQQCVIALTRAGFGEISSGPGFVSARKRTAGQWRKGQVSITVSADGEQSKAVIAAQATPQSLIGLADPPALRMVEQVIRELDLAPPPVGWAPAE